MLQTHEAPVGAVCLGWAEHWHSEGGSLEESLGPCVEGAAETGPRGMATSGDQERRGSWSLMEGLAVGATGQEAGTGMLRLPALHGTGSG